MVCIEMSFTPRVTFKVVVVGDFAVGKTSLCRRFAKREFSFEYKPTIGIDILTRTILLPYLGKVILQIWDTAGEEKFKRVIPMYFRGANYGLLVFDLTRKQTFDSVSKWYELLKKSIGEIPLILVGNKMDLKEKREVPKDEAVSLSRSLETITYIETSAMDGTNVENAFRIPAEFIIKELIEEKAKS